MRAVLWDMDGTLVDSEKLWDVGIQELCRRHGRELSAEVRTATIGGSSEVVMRIVYADLGLEPDPADVAATADWLHDYVGELFAAGLPWCVPSGPRRRHADSLADLTVGHLHALHAELGTDLDERSA